MSNKLRRFFKQQSDALAKLIQGEPSLAKQFEPLSAQYASVLEQLDGDKADDVDLEAVLGSVESICTASRELATAFRGDLAKALGVVAEKDQALADAQAKLAAFEKQVADGELIPKVKATEMASAAKTTGIEEGKQAATTEFEAKQARIKLIADRRTQLASAKTAEPVIEDVLALPDAEFAPALAKATARSAELTAKGFQLASATVRSAAWMDDAAYANEVARIDEVLAVKKTQPNHYLTPPPASKPAGIGCV